MPHGWLVVIDAWDWALFAINIFYCAVGETFGRRFVHAIMLPFCIMPAIAILLYL